MMQTIIQLVKVAKLNKDLLRGKTLDLIEGIESGSITNREDAKKVLFKDSAAPEQALTKFLRRAKRKLNLSILTSIQPNTHLQEIFKEVYTTYSAIILMLLSGHRKAAIPEARRIYNIALKYEILEIVSALGSRLAKHYAESDPNPRLSKRFAEEAETYTEYLKIYTLSNKLYSDAILRINNRSSYSPSIKAKLDHYITSIGPHRFCTIEVTTQFHILEVIQSFAQQDYPKAIFQCKQVLEFLGDKPQVRVSQKALFLSLSAVAGIASKQYDFAENRLLQALSIAGFANQTWQVYTYYRAINALHQGLYYRARHLFDEAARREQAPFIKELWAIIGAYCSFLTDSPFKLGKFFNETINASQDKGGTNIDIIIADLLLSLFRNRDRFLHRIEAVQTYTYRYLKGEQHKRVRLFLRLLCLVAQKDFNLRRIKRAGNYLLARLQKRSVYANHNLEIEIVPFEALWRVVLERLGNNRVSKQIR